MDIRTIIIHITAYWQNNYVFFTINEDVVINVDSHKILFYSYYFEFPVTITDETSPVFETTALFI